MELIKQVCSLDLAKRLKELGVKQNSFATYFVHNINGIEAVDLFSQDVYLIGDINITKRYSAFTVAELGEMLPDWFDSCKRDGSKNDWHCRVFERNSDKNYHSFAETEANARAKMLIYLIENKLI